MIELSSSLNCVHVVQQSEISEVIILAGIWRKIFIHVSISMDMKLTDSH